MHVILDSGTRRGLTALFVLAMVLAAWHGLRANGGENERDFAGNLRVVGLTDDVDTNTAQATFVNALSVPLSGTSFGVDFNPAADRLRIVSNTGQNLAHNVNAGGVTAANGVLTYTVPPAAAVPAAGITAADAGFDIYSQLSKGVTIANVSFATVMTNGNYRFYFVSLTTGGATSLGTFDDNVVDIAIPLNQ